MALARLRRHSSGFLLLTTLHVLPRTRLHTAAAGTRTSGLATVPAAAAESEGQGLDDPMHGLFGRHLVDPLAILLTLLAALMLLAALA